MGWGSRKRDCTRQSSSSQQRVTPSGAGASHHCYTDILLRERRPRSSPEGSFVSGPAPGRRWRRWAACALGHAGALGPMASNESPRTSGMLCWLGPRSAALPSPPIRRASDVCRWLAEVAGRDRYGARGARGASASRIRVLTHPPVQLLPPIRASVAITFPGCKFCQKGGRCGLEKRSPAPGDYASVASRRRTAGRIPPAR